MAAVPTIEIKMDKKEMLIQAQKNFENAQNYKFDKIDKTRLEFYSTMIK